MIQIKYLFLTRRMSNHWDANKHTAKEVQRSQRIQFLIISQQTGQYQSTNQFFSRPYLRNWLGMFEYLLIYYLVTKEELLQIFWQFPMVNFDFYAFRYHPKLHQFLLFSLPSWACIPNSYFWKEMKFFKDKHNNIKV